MSIILNGEEADGHAAGGDKPYHADAPPRRQSEAIDNNNRKPYGDGWKTIGKPKSHEAYGKSF